MKKTRSKSLVICEDRATAYAQSVVSGEQIACRFVRLACERHLRDIVDGEYTWSPERAEKGIRFFNLLKHYKGEYAGQWFKPEPWQCFIIGSIYGWYLPDGRRRFKYAYIEVPRKNGKTTLGAGFAIRELITESGAEVYSVATKEDQAKIGWRDGVSMIRNSSVLKEVLDLRVKEIRFPSKEGVWRPLGSDSETQDGLNPSFGFVDELHQWKTRALWDVIDDGMGSRKNPLILEITTAGHNQNGICYEHRKHIINVLEGKDGFKDDTFFGMIFTVDNPQDWENEEEWFKANPNLEVSKSLEFMRDQFKQSKMMTSKLNAFLNKQLNIWTQQEHCWLKIDQWDNCEEEIDDETLRSVQCVGGLDLSSSLDITALSLYWPSLNYTRSWFWCPEDGAIERQKNDRVPYLDWAAQDYIEMTPGRVVDYDYITERLCKLKEQYNITTIAYDRWNSSQLIKTLRDKGFNMKQFGQGYASMSGPSKEFEKLIAGRKIKHDQNPVMRWMVGNVAIDTDPAGNIKPKKPDAKKSDKIDGIASTVMAIGASFEVKTHSSVGFISL
jgi:phage terminase large subunit-like protein